MMKTILTLVLAHTVLMAGAQQKKTNRAAQKKDVLNIIDKVNGYWQRTHYNHGRPFWDEAAYHTGNMEAYAVTKNEAYRNFSTGWAEKNQWKGARSDNKAEWKYTYGERDNYVLFGDWQICFQ